MDKILTRNFHLIGFKSDIIHISDPKNYALDTDIGRFRLFVCHFSLSPHVEVLRVHLKSGGNVTINFNVH